jgi:ABC-type uncharacterized transport system fused permease/ATPase subunit
MAEIYLANIYFCLHSTVSRFENVPLVTPNGDVLVRELNFQVLKKLNTIKIKHAIFPKLRY